jgi:hypothetical protein
VFSPSIYYLKSYVFKYYKVDLCLCVSW